jgi:uncharacterized membrane protein (DUF4010 family)
LSAVEQDRRNLFGNNTDCRNSDICPGAYALIGNAWVAAAGGIAASDVLAAREELHAGIGSLTWPDLRSALILLAMTFIGLPACLVIQVNPREVWMIAIDLAFLSFLGDAAIKYISHRAACY